MVGVWSMVTFVDNGSGTLAGTKLYLNGAQQATDPQFTSFLTDTLGGQSIIAPVTTWLGNLEHFTAPGGGDPAVNHYYFKGGMAGISIWNAVLSTGCISDLYSAGKFGDPTSSSCASNLISGYSFKYESLKDDIGSNNATPTDITYTPP